MELHIIYRQFGEKNSLILRLISYIFGCQDVVQLGGPDPLFNWGGPAKVGPRKYFLFTESSLLFKKEHLVDFLSHCSLQ